MKKKLFAVLAVMAFVLSMGTAAFAHCGSCGVGDAKAKSHAPHAEDIAGAVSEEAGEAKETLEGAAEGLGEEHPKGSHGY